MCQYIYGRTGWSSAHVERSQLLSVLIELVVVELSELL